MANPFLAEIRIFPFNFPPKGWAFCQGQVLPISQNTALFSLLGTTYGGDGKSNFALPNMQGNAPMFYGQGNGLSLYDIGETGGSQTVTLLRTEIPAHGHNLMVDALFDGTDPAPTPTLAYAKASAGTPYSNVTTTNLVQFSANAIAPVGGNLPHNNMQPYLTLNFCIALQGVYPPRT
jgi:microcystin-dependent protein